MNIVFAGTPGFAARHLQALIDSHHRVTAVVTQPDKPGRRGKKLMPSAVKLVAEAATLPVMQPARLRVEDLQAFDCDVLVVVAFGQILKPPVLAWPRLGCINVHASLLPRWRGAAPVQRAILAGDSQFGVTLIQMDEGLDTGPILAMDSIEIDPRETAGSLFSKLEAVGPELLIRTLDEIESGASIARPQPTEGVTYAHKLDKAEAAIDWTLPAIQIDREVRAFQPEPVAYTSLGDKRIRIHQGQVCDTTGKPTALDDTSPGTVTLVSKKGIEVQCGEGKYLIERIQIPVGKGSILSPADVLNGWTNLIHAGTVFGETTPSHE
ncbi:MAG: methionyl-tRNA formyltransferase [Proteobacteria bacterium]|nr:methionyl-tRNA formyltransferase [Pseudomonadota bacterium]